MVIVENIDDNKKILKNIDIDKELLQIFLFRMEAFRIIESRISIKYCFDKCLTY